MPSSPWSSRRTWRAWSSWRAGGTGGTRASWRTRRAGSTPWNRRPRYPPPGGSARPRADGPDPPSDPARAAAEAEAAGAALARRLVRRVCADLGVAPSSFRVVGSADGAPASAALARPRPLYVSTALQLGLLPNAAVPDPVAALVPASAPAHARRFWRRWLLRPPPPALALAAQRAVGCLLPGGASAGAALPRLRAVPVGKVVSLLEAREGNAPLFRDLLAACDGLERLLAGPFDGLVRDIHAIATFEGGLDLPVPALRRDLSAAASAIRAAVAAAPPPAAASPHAALPEALFDRCEGAFRGAVNPSHPLMAPALSSLEAARAALGAAAGSEWPEELWGESAFDAVNVLVALKKRPSGGGGAMVHPRDRNGKALPRRWTTPGVEAALSDYKQAAAACEAAARRVLRGLSDDLCAFTPALVVAAHWAVALHAVAGHAAAASRLGWSPVALGAPGRRELRLRGLSPYWMARPGRAGGGVGNDVALSPGRMLLLTAPNMSGKSTLMRSALVAALLANGGLCAPCEPGGEAPRYDAFFLRAAAHDAPAEGKSAWAVECEDVASLLRDATAESLCAVDEVGRGTSARDGAALAGALLEGLCERSVSGFFATHLYELLDLPLSCLGDPGAGARLVRMGVRRAAGASPAWTYTLEDGVCRESLAVVTAREYGIPEDLLARAEALALHYDGRPGGPAAAGGAEGEPGGAAASGARPEGAAALLGAAVEAAERMLGGTFSLVPEGFDAPPALEGLSCVYVIAAREPGRPAALYVGETDAMQQRLGQHRAAMARRGLVEVSCAAVGMPDKSRAREAEAALIRGLAEDGWPLMSDHDGRHRHFAAPGRGS